MQEKPNNLQQFIEGALWGAVLGDVIGSYLQFDKDINAKKINQAFQIIGGGKHHLQPGQPTDDTQLNLAVLKGLFRGKGALNLNLIAQEMGNWFLSKPIDIGNTIRNSIPKACNMKVHQAHLCRKGASEKSQTSQSNGTLMCLTGLSIWCHRLSVQQVHKAVRQFTILIHPNELVVLSNTFYTLLVHYLLNHVEEKDKNMNAFLWAKDKLITNNGQFKKWIESIQLSFKDRAPLQQVAPINKASGWVRVALSFAIHFLVCGKSFKDSIQWIISQKGDTDTNACIMGGLLGASLGYHQLGLTSQLQKINNWRPSKQYRPQFLVPGKTFSKYASFLLEYSPKSLNLIGGEEEYRLKLAK